MRAATLPPPGCHLALAPVEEVNHLTALLPTCTPNWRNMAMSRTFLRCAFAKIGEPQPKSPVGRPGMTRRSSCRRMWVTC